MTDLDWFWTGLLAGLALAYLAVRLGRHHRDKPRTDKDAA
jgi:hypothetical protein